MDAKLREDLFRRYVTALERRPEGGYTGTGSTLEGDRSRHKDSEALLSTSTALLGAYQPDPGQRFRMVRFYEMVENSLRCQRGGNLKSLERAFHTLETICTNLLLFPWKKEFRCIKTFTGPYVYHLQSAISDAELRTLMRTIGYTCEHDSQFRLLDHPGDSSHLRQLAFELFLAQAECRLLGEVVALALRRRDSLGADIARLSVRPLDIERPYAHHLRRGSRPSKSVDVTDGAGHWHPAVNKPILKASLSLRKEPLFVDTEEDMKDEIISPVADFFPMQSPPPVDPYTSYHMSSLDDIDLYTERGGVGTGGRQTPSRPPSREPRDARDGWLLKAHGSVKCQGCGLGCSTMASCQRCDMILCSACHDIDPSPCCGLQDYHSKSPRPLDGYIPVKEKLSVYSNAQPHPHLHPHPLTLTHSHSHPHPHPQMLEKPLMPTKLFPSKSVAMTTPKAGSTERISIGGSRCGFCNKPGASHTCVNCSKVSCDSCMGLYAKDVCTRKNPQHNFVPNHQLNFKSGTISHLVYR
uniref:Spermatogenesis associated 2 n=1 Tax=Xiphophorus couchianus TaxID=32473 RepID=A0A3B5LS33_9TELE